MPKDPVSTIDAYLTRQPEAVRKTLQQVRRAIGRAIPGAVESISYQIPAYRLGTSPVVFFAGWKEHYSLYPARESLVAAFSQELAPYSISKGTIRFPLTEKVPTRLIAQLAKFLFVEASARAALKKTRVNKTGSGKAGSSKARSGKATAAQAPTPATRVAAGPTKKTPAKKAAKQPLGTRGARAAQRARAR